MKKKLLVFAGILVIGLFFHSGVDSQARGVYQIPTVAIPTVTGTPPGPVALVRRDTDQDQVNVRSGPSVRYDIIGVLIPGQEVPALGRTPGGDWIQISYPGVPNSVGWVYSPLLEVEDSIPIVEPPPTPTPQTTPTIDPTLAAQFIVEEQPTRLPTFTAPPPLAIPTYSNLTTQTLRGGIPMGIVIIGLAVVGFFGTLISFLRGR